MKLLKIAFMILGLAGAFGCTYTVKADRPANKSQVQQHSHQAESEMYDSLNKNNE